jgi:hypothetical protein
LPPIKRRSLTPNYAPQRRGCTPSTIKILEKVEISMTDGGRGSLSWKKSTASAESNCVEVANDGDAVFVRDSKDPRGPVLAFTRSEWDAFLTGVHAGEFK